MKLLIDAVTAALEQAGLKAAAAIPKGVMPRLSEPVTAVVLEQAELRQAGLFSYLGILDDPQRGQTELYGKKLEAVIMLDTFCPVQKGADACQDRTQALCQLLLQKGIDGVQVESFSADQCCFDSASSCFRQKLRLKTRAYVYALRAGEEEEFTDFTLKGDWK